MKEKITGFIQVLKSEFYSKLKNIDISIITNKNKISIIIEFKKYNYKLTFLTFLVYENKILYNNKNYYNYNDFLRDASILFRDIENIPNYLDLFIYKLDNEYLTYNKLGSTKLSIFDIDYDEFKTYLIINNYSVDTELLDFILNKTNDYLLLKQILFYIFLKVYK